MYLGKWIPHNLFDLVNLQVQYDEKSNNMTLCTHSTQHACQPQIH